MKAAVVRAFKQPLVLEDRPIPEPGEGQVLVKIEASGLSGLPQLVGIPELNWDRFRWSEMREGV